MTSEARLLQLGKWQTEYYKDDTTDERKVEILTTMREWMEEEMPESKCITCGHGGLYIPDERPRIEGHCYSIAGMQDYQRFTKVCEWCFDKSCLDQDDPRRAEWFGVES